MRTQWKNVDFMLSSLTKNFRVPGVGDICTSLLYFTQTKQKKTGKSSLVIFLAVNVSKTPKLLQTLRVRSRLKKPGGSGLDGSVSFVSL